MGEWEQENRFLMQEKINLVTLLPSFHSLPHFLFNKLSLSPIPPIIVQHIEQYSHWYIHVGLQSNETKKKEKRLERQSKRINQSKN